MAHLNNHFSLIELCASSDFQGCDDGTEREWVRKAREKKIAELGESEVENRNCFHSIESFYSCSVVSYSLKSQA